MHIVQQPSQLMRRKRLSVAVLEAFAWLAAIVQDASKYLDYARGSRRWMFVLNFVDIFIW